MPVANAAASASSTYGNIAWVFGDGAPGYGRKPVFGLFPTQSDEAIRIPTNDECIAEQVG
ncbi:MAG TPA: hypothetical protein VF695_06130 [Sphingomonas sp.]|jgi:hypothetical protein